MPLSVHKHYYLKQVWRLRPEENKQQQKTQSPPSPTPKRPWKGTTKPKTDKPQGAASSVQTPRDCLHTCHKYSTFSSNSYNQVLLFIYSNILPSIHFSTSHRMLYPDAHSFASLWSGTCNPLQIQQLFVCRMWVRCVEDPRLWKVLRILNWSHRIHALTNLPWAAGPFTKGLLQGSKRETEKISWVS